MFYSNLIYINKKSCNWPCGKSSSCPQDARTASLAPHSTVHFRLTRLKTLSFKSYEHWSHALYALEGSGRAALGAQLSPHRSDVFCEGLFLVLKLSPHMRCQPPASRTALHKSRRHVRPTDSGRAWLRRRPIDPLTSLAAARPPCACLAPPTPPASHTCGCKCFATYTLLFHRSC